MSRLFLFFFSLLVLIKAEAQIDREFWFVAPLVTKNHADQPVYFYFSALNEAATVTISMPANPGFKTLSYNILPNKTLQVNMTPYLSTLENQPNGTVLNKGVHITSTAYITAYYEVLGIENSFGPANTEVFNLKGGRGLGLTFYTPFQTVWANNSSVGATSAIDIVATEDNTTVTITITQPANGLAAGSTFTINLNKGETYSVQADLYTGPGHLAGSLVTADKPIAVTVKDDSVLDGYNYDLIGDQIVPVNVLGTQYIAVKGPSLYYSSSDYPDLVVIGGTVNGTSVFINGAPYTVNAGQTIQYQTAPTQSVYISSSQPVYAFQVLGLLGQDGFPTYGSELAGNLLPPLECTGSKQIGFQRSTPVSHYADNYTDSVYLSVVVKTGMEKYFKLINANTGKSLPFPFPSTAKFTPVSTSGYSNAVAIYPTSVMNIGAYKLINDSVDFNMSLMYGEEGHSFTIADFADYGGIFLGGNQTICNTTTLTLDAGPDKSSYLWQPGGATAESIVASAPGLYKVTVTKGSCTYTDSAQISYYPPLPPLFNPDSVSFCANTKLPIASDSVYNGYSWQTGSKNSSIIPSATGYYKLTITDKNGCQKTDSIYVNVNPLPTVKISDNQPDTTAFCTDSNVTLTAIPVNAEPKIISYLWQNGGTTNTYDSTHHSYPDVYWVKTTSDSGCVTTDTLFADCTPYIWVPNVFTPNNDPLHTNEVFFVKGLKPNKWSLDIYNRWGGQVYYNKNYDNTWNGAGLDDGVYYYYLHHIKNKANIRGWVQIVR